MKRWPLLASFVLFIALSACAAYWALQLFKPPLRPVAAPPRNVQPEVRIDAAAGLFGGHSGRAAAVASNFQLKGVIFADREYESVAILSADGKPAQAIRVGKEVTPGVTIKEVHRDHVLLSDNGVNKRVELPESAKGQSGMSPPAGVTPAATRPSSIPAAPPSQPVAQPSTPPQPGPPPAQNATSARSSASSSPAQQAAPPPPPAPTPAPAAPTPSPAPAAQTAQPTVVTPSTETPQLNPPNPSSDSTFGTPSPPLYSPGRAGGG